jgi:hypothetical protein
MQEAAAQTDFTIAVLSENYLKSAYFPGPHVGPSTQQCPAATGPLHTGERYTQPSPKRPFKYRSESVRSTKLLLFFIVILVVFRANFLKFSAKFSLPKKKLPFPALIFSGQLKTRHASGTNFEPYPIPVLADPKKLIQALDQLRTLKASLPPTP